MRQIGNGDRHEVGRRLDNCAENSHSGASPRSPAPTFPGAVFSNTNSATAAVSLRLPVATTARDAGRLWSCPSHPRGFRGFAALGLACLSALSATQADAEVAIDGGQDEMQVRVENDTVGHVLEALGQNGNLHDRSATPLNKVMSLTEAFQVPWNTFCSAFSTVTILSSGGRRGLRFRRKRRGVHLTCADRANADR